MNTLRKHLTKFVLGGVPILVLVFASFAGIPSASAAPVPDSTTKTLTVDLIGTWLAGINVELYKNDGGIIWTAYNQQGAVRTYNVAPGIYDLKLRQGTKVLDVADINCTGETCSAGDVTAELTVDLSGTWLGGINVELYKDDGGLIWTAYNQHGASRTYNVLKNTYDLKLRQGPKVLDVANISCTGETCNAGDVIAQLTVDLSGTWLAGINVELYKDDGGIIWTAYNQQGAVRTYNVLKNTYDLKLRQGPKVLDVANINCTGETGSAGDVTAQLTINLTGLGVFNTELHLNDSLAGSAGSLIWTAYNQSGTLVYNVLKNTYDVLLRQGSNLYSWDAADCTGDTCVLDKATLTVNFPGISGVHVYLRNNDGVVGTATGANVQVQYNQINSAVFTGLTPGLYDVVLVRNAKTKIVDAVLALGGNAAVNNIVQTLTVDFTGVKGVHVYVRTNDGKVGEATGGDVEVLYYQNDKATIIVLENTYDVVLVRNAKTKVVDAVNCEGPSACEVKDIVQTLKVNFPGINGVHVYVRTDDGISNESATGGNVEVLYNQNGSASIPVLENTYDVVLVRNAKTKVVDAVACEGPSACTVDNIVSTLSISFPGFNGVHVYVRTDDGKVYQATGGDVEVLYNQNGSATFVLLKNYYDVVLVINGSTGIADAVNCTGATCTLAGSDLQINAPAGVLVQVKHYTSGAVITSGTTAWTNWMTFSNLPIGIYDIALTQGTNTVIIQDYFHISANTMDMLDQLTVNAPANTGVEVLKSGGLVTSGTTAWNDLLTLYLVKDTYDLRLTQKAEVKTVNNVDCSGETQTIDQLSVLTVNAPANTDVEVLKSGGLVTSGTTAWNGLLTLNLVKDTYDLRLTQKAEVKTVNTVDCTGETQTIDQLSVLTVTAPPSTNVKVYVPGTTKEVISGTTEWNGLLTLSVVSDTYDIYLKQNFAEKTVKALDISSDKSINELCTLTVTAAPSTTIYVYVTGTTNVVTSGTTAWTGSVTLNVVRDTYVVFDGTTTKKDIDCTGATQTVTFP